MAISTKTVMDEGLLNMIDNYLGSNLIAFLVNDNSGTLDKTFSMSSVASLEISEGFGYTRKQVTLNSASMVGSVASATSQELDWTASGGTIPAFTHICFAIGGNLTNGDTSGVINRIEPVSSGSSISLGDGEKYIYSFQVTQVGTYNS
jgi:hypothetical protein